MIEVTGPENSQETAFAGLGSPSSSPTPTVSNQAAVPPAPTKSKKGLLWLFIILLLILSLVGAYFLGQSKQADAPTDQDEEEQVIEEEQVEEPVVEQVYDRTELLFTKFIADSSGGNDFSYEFWLLDLTDNQKRQLDLPEAGLAFKNPTSPKVFFTQIDNENTVFIQNTLTGEVARHEVISHPKAEVREGVTISDANSIAPDDSMLIYSVWFSEPCPSPSVTLPPNFEGGFGPCEPEPDPNLPAGYYLYDVKTKTSTHLGGVVLPSLWDLPNNKLYFNDIDSNKGLKVLDLVTKQISLFDSAQTFGYGAVPMLKANFLVKFEGQTGDVAGQTSSSTLSLVNLTSRVQKVLDSGRWAEIQPFASVAPDESKFLYVRSTLDSRGRALYSLHLYELQTGSLKQVTPASTTNSYSIRGYWPDNNNFITMVNETGNDYDSNKNYLVKINLRDGSVTKLIDDLIFRFQQN